MFIVRLITCRVAMLMSTRNVEQAHCSARSAGAMDEDGWPLRLLMLVTLVVCATAFLLIVNHRLVFRPAQDYFYSPMTTLQQREIMELLARFLDILKHADVEHFVIGGTLLGSVRHHGLIPWDDDIDVSIDESARDFLVNVVNRAPYHEEFVIYSGSDLLSVEGQWKFYRRKESRVFLHRPFRWPYIDIWFHRHNGSHLLSNHRALPMSLSHVYPLAIRPFGQLNVPVPCNISFMIHDLNIRQCRSRSFSHLLELPLYNAWQRELPCARLYNQKPFVFVQQQSTEYAHGPQIIPYYRLYELDKIYNYTKRFKHFPEPPGLKSHQELLKLGQNILQNISIFQPLCTGLR